MPTHADSFSPTIPAPAAAGAILVEHVDFCYGTHRVLQAIQMEIPANEVTAFIGPSGCGKSTLLRCFNRMNDLVDNARVTSGRILVHGEDIHKPDLDPVRLRQDVGMVFQKSNPFPMSIHDNVAYGLRIAGIKDKAEIATAVETSLRGAALWEEVKDRLNDSALGLSGGQQQRLCIARAMAVKPRVLLMDEPCSALDPIATGKVEELIRQLKEQVTVVIVTHNMQQAVRVSSRTAFFYLGELVEFDDTGKIFSEPSNPRTEAYVTGRFG